MPDHFYFRLVHADIEKKYRQCRAMHIMSGILMIIYGMQFLTQYKTQYVQILALLPPGIIIIFLSLFKKNIFKDQNNNRIFRVLELGILLMGAMYFLKGNNVLPASLYFSYACMLLYLLYIEGRLFTAQYIDVTAMGVSISLPTHTKKMNWSEIKNIVVKDIWFTIETQNQSILQYPVHNSLSDEEFIRFLALCRQKLGGQL